MPLVRVPMVVVSIVLHMHLASSHMLARAIRSEMKSTILAVYSLVSLDPITLKLFSKPVLVIQGPLTLVLQGHTLHTMSLRVCRSFVSW